MQPENNVPNTATGPKIETALEEVVAMETKPVEQPAAQPVAQPPKDDVVFNNKPKKSNVMLIGLILCLILAAGGIGFGVWAMMDKNAQEDRLNSQISALSNQLQEKNENNTDDDITSDAAVNPVISSQNPDEVNRVYFNTVGDSRIRLMIDGGVLTECAFESDTDHDSAWDVTTCDLGTIDGEIYKAISFGGTQEYDPYVGLIMTDGTVKYFSFYDAMNNGEYSLKTLSLDGKVIDSVKIAAGPSGGSAGGYISNVFVLNDGTFLKFDESMLEQ